MEYKISAASLGVVLSGGGTRSAYAVGAMRALAEVHGITQPKVLVALSGGAGPGVFYLARRYDEMYEWARRFDDPRFISWKRLLNRPIMDIQFLINGILAQQAPNLEEEVVSTYFIAAAKLPDGSLHWFSQESAEPLFEQLKATKTASGVSQWWVEIGGVHYSDGCLAATVDDAVAKAYQEGAEHVILVDNSCHGRLSFPIRFLMRFSVRNAPECVKVLVRKDCARVTHPLMPNSRLTICRPEKLPMRHGLIRTSRLLQATIDLGYADMAKLTSFSLPR